MSNIFEKMRNAFTEKFSSMTPEEREAEFQEQRQARIKVLLAEREMQMDALKDMWKRPNAKRSAKKKVIESITEILEELSSIGYELSEEEKMVPVLPGLGETMAAPTTAEGDAAPVKTGGDKDLLYSEKEKRGNGVDYDLYAIDDKPGIPISTIKPKKTAYDIVSLPSRGQCYPKKKESVAVAYLTAADENIIASPVLYNEGKIVDQLLYNNLVDEDFNPEDLCVGDVDAIMLWLRAEGYGYDFPVSVTDPDTGDEIKTTINLASIKTKEFKLEGDENGWFDFTMPKCGAKIKFKYLTRAMERRVQRADLLENPAINQRRMEGCLRDMAEILAHAKVKDSMPLEEKQKVLEGLKKWHAAVDEEAQINYTKLLTNKLELSIMAVDGNTDREFIHEFITNLRSVDSYAFRQYYNENEPGLDFEVEIERPKDEQGRGGGSFKTLFPWDDSIFYRIGKI